MYVSSSQVDCAPSIVLMNTQATTETGNGEQRAKHKPQPKQAYRITLNITDAPGPFASAEGIAQYDVVNEPECGNYLKSVGVFPRITSNEPFALTRVSDTEFQGIVYVDLMLDEDYYGRGVCHWEFTEARVRLKSNGVNADTAFLPSIRASSIIIESSESRYFWKGYYPQEVGYEDFPHSGQEKIEHVPADKLHEFFSISMRAKAAKP